MRLVACLVKPVRKYSAGQRSLYWAPRMRSPFTQPTPYKCALQSPSPVLLLVLVW